MTVTMENQITWRKTYPGANLCITTLTWPSLRLNPGLCCNIQLTKCPSPGMAHNLGHLMPKGQTDLPSSHHTEIKLKVLSLIKMKTSAITRNFLPTPAPLSSHTSCNRHY